MHRSEGPVVDGAFGRFGMSRGSAEVHSRCRRWSNSLGRGAWTRAPESSFPPPVPRRPAREAVALDHLGTRGGRTGMTERPRRPPKADEPGISAGPVAHADERNRTSKGCYSHENLNLARLPVPPHPRGTREDSSRIRPGPCPGAWPRGRRNRSHDLRGSTASAVAHPDSGSATGPTPDAVPSTAARVGPGTDPHGGGAAPCGPVRDEDFTPRQRRRHVRGERPKRPARDACGAPRRGSRRRDRDSGE